MSTLRSEEKIASPLQVGKWYAEIEDDGCLGVLYQCVETFRADGDDLFVMVDESDDSEPRYVYGRGATTEFWMPQL